jgi:DNA invertase Pin-like site-specific DNA recombinase
MEAYIYARFSTLEQAKGSSLARQLNDCRSFCDRMGWTRAQDRELVDEGRSAFDGANRADGSCLAVFERDAEAGVLPVSTVLVVERLDRLSRQSAVDVFRLVSRLTDLGVVIATVDGERIYRKGSFEFMSLIELIMKAQVSHEESEKKSQRLSAAWARKRERAFGGDKTALTRRCPAWIGVDEQSGRYVLLDDRADVVRRIFHLTTSGQGKHLIARTLNREGIRPWGRGDGWHPSYIQKILTSRTVLGEMQAHRKVAGKRVVEGEPIQNYYPSVVDESTFERAQADRASRAGMRGRRGKRISNLFSGIARCGSCGGSMTFRNKGKEGEQYLVCDAGLRGRACDYTVHFNYPALEAAVIDQTLHLALTDRHFQAPETVREVETELAEKRRWLADVEGRRRRLVDLLSRIEDPEVERQLSELHALAITNKVDVAEAERRLTFAKGERSPSENLARIRALTAAINSEDEMEGVVARGTVQQALRSVIGSIICDPAALLT